jgi:flagellar biosynthesis protein FlhG
MMTSGDQADGIRALALRGQADKPLRPGAPERRATFSARRSIAVTSGKGGVGKTQVSANLAVALARQGHRVLVLDADLGLASQDLVLGVTPHSDLLALLERGLPASEVLVEGPAGVMLLPACPGRYEMANLGGAERDRLVAAVDAIAKDFDVLVVDTGAGLGSNSVAFAALADEVIIVATPDPTSLRDAYAMAKVLHRRGGVERVGVVANQVGSDQEGREVHARLAGIVERFLDLELDYLGGIRRDEAVRRAVGAGLPFVLGAPESQPARVLREIAKRLGPTPREAVPC